MTSTRERISPQKALAGVLAFILACTGGGLVLAALAMPFVAASGTVSNATTSLFDDLPTDLTFDQPSEQSVILAADGSEIARFYAENRIVVDGDEISQNLRDAVVAIEDERFYEHRGIDPQGIVGAAFNNLTGGNLAGGSTITQQYVRNLLIEQGRFSNDENLISAATERSLARKLAEARMAIAIEKQMSKDEILTGYLNVAMFGPSQYGAEAASQYFFSVPASELSIPQAAMLAGITQSPARWNPITQPEQAKVRRDTVLAKMYELGFITNDEFRAATETPIEDMLNVSTPTNGCVAANVSAYFCEYVVKDVLANESWGESPEDRLNQLYRGGLIIHTTIDPGMQQAAYDSIVEQIPVNDPSSVEMSQTTIQPGTGHILTMVQNTNFGQASAEDPGATPVNLNVGRNRGGGSGFQSGSTFKVFTLIEWIRSGRSVFERIDADKRQYPRDSWNISCAPEYKDDYNTAKNLEGVGSGMMTVLDSTTRSVNLSFVNMANQLDMCDIVGTAEAMGVERGDGQPLTPNPSAVLGSNNVTPLSMANSMATLANDGIICEPMSFTKIENHQGETIAEFEPNCNRVLEQSVVDTTTQVLQQVLAQGATGARAIVPGHEFAGKTGTANNDWHAWFMGYSEDYATAIWSGHMEGNVSMFNSVINGQFHREVYGGLYPAQAFSGFYQRVLAGAPAQTFGLGELRESDSNIIPGGRGNPTRPTPQPSPEPPQEESADSNDSDSGGGDSNEDNNGSNGDSPDSNSGDD